MIHQSNFVAIRELMLSLYGKVDDLPEIIVHHHIPTNEVVVASDMPHEWQRLMWANKLEREIRSYVYIHPSDNITKRIRLTLTQFQNIISKVSRVYDPNPDAPALPLSAHTNGKEPMLGGEKRINT